MSALGRPGHLRRRPGRRDRQRHRRVGIPHHLPHPAGPGLPARAGQRVQHRRPGPGQRERGGRLPAGARRAAGPGGPARRRPRWSAACSAGSLLLPSPTRSSSGPCPSSSPLAAGAHGRPAPDQPRPLDRPAADPAGPRRGWPWWPGSSSPGSTAATSAPPRGSSSSPCWPSSSTTTSSGSTAPRTPWPSRPTLVAGILFVAATHVVVVGGRADRRRVGARRPGRRSLRAATARPPPCAGSWWWPGWSWPACWPCEWH